MRLMKSLIALLLAMMTLVSIPAFAEGDGENDGLVQRDPLLDVAFTMLEKGNPFLDIYNQITGANVEPYFEYGLPYFFGGKHYFTIDGESLLFSRYPDYAKRDCWEDTAFYHKGAYYLYGLDCNGYTNWILSELGLPAHDTLMAMITQYGEYGDNHIYSHRPGKGMPPYGELAETLQLGDMLVYRKGSRHIMMYIGTLREFGYTAETAPELADYLDHALVIHCGRHPDYPERMQQFLDEHAGDPYYNNVKTPYGGVGVSIIGIKPEDAPHQKSINGCPYSWFDLDGYKLTTWELEDATSYCWFRLDAFLEQ